MLDHRPGLARVEDRAGFLPGVRLVASQLLVEVLVCEVDRVGEYRRVEFELTDQIAALDELPLVPLIEHPGSHGDESVRMEWVVWRRSERA
ncbi:MAG: hypothetical protein R3F29_15225 [Planctomycetota bacterium]